VKTVARRGRTAAYCPCRDAIRARPGRARPPRRNNRIRSLRRCGTEPQEHPPSLSANRMTVAGGTIGHIVNTFAMPPGPTAIRSLLSTLIKAARPAESRFCARQRFHDGALRLSFRRPVALRDTG